MMLYKYKMNVWNSGKEKKVRQPCGKRERLLEGKTRAIAKNIQEKWPSIFTTGDKNHWGMQREGKDRQARVR